MPSWHRCGQGSDGEWPRRSFLELGALPSAVPCARLHTRQLTWEWALTGLSEDTELIVSELITNAVRAARSLPQPRPVRLWLLADTARILILAWDASEQTPVRVDVDADIEGGRGLLLVEAMSSQWSWFSTPETGGKIVWALCVPDKTEAWPMSDRPSAISPESLPQPGEVALLTAIDAALDVRADELPGRVTLVRRYIAAALDAVPGSRRARLLVIAQMLARDVSHDGATDGGLHRSQ